MYKKLVIILTSCGLWACTDAIPEIESLVSSDVAIKISGSSSFTLAWTNPSIPIIFQGECISGVSNIDARIFNGAWEDLSNVSQGAPLINCEQSNYFSFNLKSLDSWGSFDSNQTQSVVIELKGKNSQKTYSPSSRITILYTPPAGKANPNQLRASSGAGVGDSANYRVKARAGHVHGEVSSSANYQIKRK